MDVHDLFNDKLRALIADLVFICPDVSDFRMLRNAFSMAVSIDRTSPQKYFAQFIGPYADQSRASDERFFLEHRYEDVTGLIGTDVVEKIKGVWGTLGDENKATVWKYFQVLLVLSAACSG